MFGLIVIFLFVSERRIPQIPPFYIQLNTTSDGLSKYIFVKRQSKKWRNLWRQVSDICIMNRLP